LSSSDIQEKPVFVFKGDALANYGFGDDHPFGLDRHEAFQVELADAALGSAIEYAGTRRASVDELSMFHSADYIDFISKRSAEGTGYLDGGDTPAYAGIFDTASDVAGTTLAAVDAVMSGDTVRAFSPIAGLHHAGREHAAGFCVFNDCGIAFADLHEDGRYLYPGTGAAEETGKGAATGTKLNIPMPPGAGDDEFDAAWQVVEAYIDNAAPEFIIMQCGADSLEGDPITHLCYTEEAHALAAKRLCKLADRHCNGRIVGTGGGGYNRRNLARAWTRVVQSFADTA
jgi:acetoin utilization protein AcuC